MFISRSFVLHYPHEIPRIALLYSCPRFQGSIDGQDIPVNAWSSPYGRLSSHLSLPGETCGSPKFPGSPHEHMPWSQTPVVSPTLATPGRYRLLNVLKTAAFRSLHGVGFPLLYFRRVILMSTIILISGLNTEPAPSFHPA